MQVDLTFILSTIRDIWNIILNQLWEIVEITCFKRQQ